MGARQDDEQSETLIRVVRNPRTTSSSYDSLPGSHSDLIELPLIAAFTTIQPDGSPQTTAVGYTPDELGRLRIPTPTRYQKYKNLQRDPRCTLFIQDPQDWHRTLEIRARAELAPDPELEFRTLHYERYGLQMRVETSLDFWVVTLVPVRVIAQDANSAV
jgi:PPOX class probable F420-dependent enzyme